MRRNHSPYFFTAQFFQFVVRQFFGQARISKDRNQTITQNTQMPCKAIIGHNQPVAFKNPCLAKYFEYLALFKSLNRKSCHEVEHGRKGLRQPSYKGRRVYEEGIRRVRATTVIWRTRLLVQGLL